MKKKLPLLVSILIVAFHCYAQHTANHTSQNKPGESKENSESREAARKDSLKLVRFKALAYYPLLNAGPMSGVLPITGVDEIPDPSREYKILFEFTINPPDSIHKNINEGLVEICRVINLHIASGIPLSHIHAVIVAHGPSVFSLLNKEAFYTKYKSENPNISVVEALQKVGVRIVACGQYMAFQELKKEQLLPGIKLSLTAKTVLSNYIGQGYVWYDIGEEK